MKNLLPNPYLLAFGITLLSYVMLYGLKRLLSAHLTRKKKHHESNKWDEIIVHTANHTTQLFMVGSSLFIAFQYVPHSTKLNYYADRIYFGLLMMQVAIWTNFLMDQWITSTINKKTRQNRAASSSISLLKLLSKFLLFSVIFLFTLHNMNIKITTIIAGLGVGGIAVALAIQKILGDLLSSLSIVLDKPFVVGDFIIMDQYLGEIEKIGLRTTQIRSLTGEQIILPNSIILNSGIRNMKRMHERRVVLHFSLTLETPPQSIELAVSLIKAIVCSKDRVRMDRCHFSAITRTSFDIELIYFFLNDDYNLHMDTQHMILMDIYRAFMAENLRFAYPAQTLHQTPTEILMRQMPESNNIGRVDREKFV